MLPLGAAISLSRLTLTLPGWYYGAGYIDPLYGSTDSPHELTIDRHVKTGINYKHSFQIIRSFVTPYSKKDHSFRKRLPEVATVGIDEPRYNSMRPFYVSVATAGFAGLAALSFSSPSFAIDGVDNINGASSANSRSWLGGVQGGYNWQSGSIVYGVESDFSFTHLNSATDAALTCSPVPCSADSPPPSAHLFSTIDWYGTARGRLGFSNGPMLIYATGGLAYGQVSLNNNFQAPDIVHPFSLTSATSSVKTGWVLGSGVEYALNPHMHISLGYQYIDLGSTLSSKSDMTFNSVAQTAKTNAQFHVISLGLSWALAPTDTPSKPWEGSYIGIHSGGNWGNRANGHYTSEPGT